MTTTRIAEFFLFLVVFSMFASASEGTVITPDSFHGEMLGKAIKYLRSLGLAGSADNIELYMNRSLLIVKKLDKGDQGENDGYGEPVFIDPNAFPPKKLGWRTDKPADLTAMLLLATTIIHEKFHSENHRAWDRAGSNLRYKAGGNNPMEVEAWNHTMKFLDTVIAEILAKANKPGISPQEKAMLLRTAEYLLEGKLAKLRDYKDNAYGPPIWNASDLERIKNLTAFEREKLENAIQGGSDASGEGKETSLKNIIGEHLLVEERASQALAARSEALKKEQLQAMKDFSEKIVELVAAAQNRRTLSQAEEIRVAFKPEPPNDFNAQEIPMLITFSPEQGASISSAGSANARYSVTVPESAVVNLIKSDNPTQAARWMLRQGMASVSGPNLASQFEACGNGVLDVQEDCDYGNSCQQGLKCSVFCACVILTDEKQFNLRGLQPKDPAYPFLKNYDFDRAQLALDEYMKGVPGFALALFENEEIELKITDDAREYLYSAAIAGGGVKKFLNTRPEAPTIRIVADKRTLENIRDSVSPMFAGAKAFAEDVVKVEPLSEASATKLAVARIAARNFAEQNNPFKQNARIEYKGQPTQVGLTPRGLAYLAFDDKPLRIILDDQGTPAGYSNAFAFNAIQTDAMLAGQARLSAGIYAYPPDHYSDYWGKSAIKPATLPGPSTPFNPLILTKNAFDTGKAYASSLGRLAS